MPTLLVRIGECNAGVGTIPHSEGRHNVRIALRVDGEYQHWLSELLPRIRTCYDRDASYAH